MVSEVALFSMIATGELDIVDMANRIIAATKKYRRGSKEEPGDSAGPRPIADGASFRRNLGGD